MNKSKIVGACLIGVGVYLNKRAVLLFTAKTIHGVQKMIFKCKMRKGIKEGSIVEHDGEYYEIHFVEEA